MDTKLIPENSAVRSENAEDIRSLFVCAASRAYGEINVVLPLAQGVAQAGGEVWFLVSPLAAQLARSKFPDRVFEMTGDCITNQITFWRIVKKFRPNMVVFPELYQILQIGRKPECPLVDWKLLQDLQELEATLVFIDFIAHVQMLQNVVACDVCAKRFGRHVLRAFLERLWVMVPCPLNEPGQVQGRRGIPYRTRTALPVVGPSKDKSRCRLKFLGRKDQKEGVLILRSNSTWQAELAEQQNLHLHEYFTDLLTLYLDGLGKPVSLVSVSDRNKLRLCSDNKWLKVINLPNLPPDEYQTLLHSADLILTDNEISYSVGNAIGNTPTVVFVNSFSAKELFERERADGALGRLISRVKQKWPSSFFPHAIYPLRMQKRDMIAFRSTDPQQDGPSDALLPSTIRLGRMSSSPFFRAELYGGRETKDLLHRLLLDRSTKQELLRHETSYLSRLNQIESGVTVLKQLHAAGNSHTVM